MKKTSNPITVKVEKSLYFTYKTAVKGE